MEYREIPLTQGRVARVSPEDYEELSRFSWCASVRHNRGGLTYAMRNVHETEDGRSVCRPIYMHRQILGPELEDAPEGTVVMHLDGDGLNCTRPNLRLGTYAANNQHDRDRIAMQRSVEAARAKRLTPEQMRRREDRYTELIRRGIIPA